MDGKKLSELKAWDKLPSETSKSYKAFYTYLTMADPNNPAQQKRSIERTGAVLGYKKTSHQLLYRWSSANNWVARAEAYDAYMATQIITFKQVELGEYQAAVVGSLVQQLALMDEILAKKLTALRQEAIDSPHLVDPKEINQILSAIKTKDDLARRAGKMPTSYIREDAPADDEVEYTFVIGGGDEQ